VKDFDGIPDLCFNIQLLVCDPPCCSPARLHMLFRREGSSA
jgi:predicted ester cyclase